MHDPASCPAAWRRRLFVGVAGPPSLDRVHAVAVEVIGPGLEARAQVAGAAEAQLDGEVARRGAGTTSTSSLPVSQIVSDVDHLAAAQAKAAERLVRILHHEPEAPVAAGLLNPRWGDDRLAVTAPAPLAEATGWNVVDDFAGRDRAQNGLGGPVLARAYWLLLRDPKRDRVLLDLGDTIRLVYLPAGCEAVAAGRVFAMDVAPGTRLLDRLAATCQLSIPTPEDHGKAAAEGRLHSSVLQPLLDEPSLPGQPPAWSADGIALEPFLDPLHGIVGTRGGTPPDALITATHLMAAATTRCLLRHVPEAATRPEILLHGPGRRNGMLTRLIKTAFEQTTVTDIDETGVESNRLDAAGAAVMAQLWADQVPQSGMFISGTNAPRVLGRLTPGSPQNWRRLLLYMAEAAPQSMPLRSAV